MMEEDRPGPLAGAEGWIFITQRHAHVRGLKDNEGKEYKEILIEI